MDKLMNNNWFMRIIALLFALMLYASVNIESPATSNKPGNSIFPTATATDSAILTDIPVKAYYNENEYVVRGIPQTVTVTLEGPTSVLTTTKQVKDFEIYVDLTNLPTGTHRVQLKQKNISDKLKVTIAPSVITVTIHQKVTKDFLVDVEYVNQSKMKEGYSVEEAVVNPNTVKITGAEEDIDHVAVVMAKVNLENVGETIEQEAKVTVYDQNGNILPVEVEPSIVTVTVPVISPSKSLPVNIKKVGSLKDGWSISSISTTPNEVTVFGPKDVLNQLDFIDGITIDLSKVTDDTTLEMEIPKPKGVTKIVPEKIQLKIEIDKQQERTFNNLPIKTIGLSDNQRITFLDPKSGKLNVQIKGTDEVLKNLKESDIELYVNVADLGEGVHKVKIEVNGPQNIDWKLSKEEVNVQITSNDAFEMDSDHEDNTSQSS